MCSHYGLLSGVSGLSFFLVYMFGYIGKNPFYFFDLVFNLLPFLWLGCVIGLVGVGYAVEYRLGDIVGGRRIRTVGWLLIGCWLLSFAYVQLVAYLP